MDLGLRGLRALVTGGTKGIGRHVAEAFAAEGASVSICARDEAEVAGTVAALEGRGVAAFGRALDVADKAALEEWVKASAEALGGIDMVVANVSALSVGADEAAWVRWSPIRGQCRGIAALGSGPRHVAASMTAGPAWAASGVLPPRAEGGLSVL